MCHCQPMEEEILALVKATQEMLRLCKLKILRIWSAKTPTMFIDNESAQAFADGSAQSNQSRHIGLRYHFARDLVSKGEMQLQHKSSNEMIADNMTKALGPTKFETFRQVVINGLKENSTMTSSGRL